METPRGTWPPRGRHKGLMQWDMKAAAAEVCGHSRAQRQGLARPSGWGQEGVGGRAPGAGQWRALEPGCQAHHHRPAALGSFLGAFVLSVPQLSVGRGAGDAIKNLL